jgi:hypothetical protein
MILGFKTGPKNFPTGQEIVSDLGASMCEVWFNVNKHEEYKEMISWLQKNNVAIGLHYWGVVDGKIKPNLATQDEHVRNETLQQIRQTIDIGADIGCVYVNIHPGAQAIETIDFTNWEQTMTSDPITTKELATELLLLACNELHEYALTKNVLLTIESIPAREARRDTDREHIYDPGNASLVTMERIAQEGMWVANDITHGGSHAFITESSTDAAWEKFMEFSTRTQNQTRLLHINTVTPPYNGTDSHDGITAEDFQKETFPTKEGMIEFLTLFKNRNDVYTVPEPKENPAENYQALQALAEGI